MLQSMFIQNYKAWENQTFTFNGEHAVFFGENDSGKTSILEALDCFFNRNHIEREHVRIPGKDVSIGIRYNGTTFKKTFSGKTLRVKHCRPAESWHELAGIHYLLLPATEKSTDAILKELARARADYLLSSELEETLAAVAQRAADEVLAGAGPEADSGGKHPTELSAVPQVNLARAIDFAIEGNGVPLTSGELGYRKNFTYAMLVGGDYPNVLLGIDDVERAFTAMDYSSIIGELESHFGQVLMTTRSAPVVQHKERAIAVPVGSNPSQDIADILKGLTSEGKAFLLVEGKYDLPWYRKAVSLAGLDARLNILPAGGSNLDQLQREISSMGIGCISIVDGDTKPDVRHGKFALKRECVELYTPDALLDELFGIRPSKESKVEFFRQAKSVRQASENGIKAAISERIERFLTTEEPFVAEVRALLEHAL